MKAIIGLGNPGKAYEKTRHNAGFLCVDFLRDAFTFEDFKTNKNMSAKISTGLIDNEKILLVKPTTFMNRSGESVQALMHFYKLSPMEIAVLHDDLDIAPGALRVTVSSRAAGHNGVQNIIDHLGTQDFFRIRLGIGHPNEILGACMPSHDFVLQNFSPKEHANLSELFLQSKNELLHWLSIQN